MNSEQFKQWLRSYNKDQFLAFPKPLIMGILNLTPDSFSDGGQFNNLEKALERSRQMLAEEVDIIDIGGESTRPGAAPVTAEEEIKRVVPIIKAIRAESDIAISIDTSKALVMEAAINAGASIINDITALESEESKRIAAILKVPICLMHMQGNPLTMQINPYYESSILDVLNQFFKNKIEACLNAGIEFANLIIDPGFGFGKTKELNLQLINGLDNLHRHERPVMLGFSRKSSLGLILNKPVTERLHGGIAAAVFAALKGLAIIRTHDIAETKQAFNMLEAINSVSENKVRAPQ